MREGHVDFATEALVDAVLALRSSRTLRELARHVSDAARRITRASGATFVLRNGPDCHYVGEASVRPQFRGKRFPIEACISGWTMEHAETAFVKDVTTDPRVARDAYDSTLVRSLCMVPIRRSKPLGALGVYWQEQHDITPEGALLLQALADATAPVLERFTPPEAPAEAEPGLDGARFPRLEGEGSSWHAGDGARRTDPAPIVTFCAWTRRVLMDGRWVLPEEFLHERYGLEISHGMSDEAAAELFAAMAADELRPAGTAGQGAADGDGRTAPDGDGRTAPDGDGRTAAAPDAGSACSASRSECEDEDP